MTKFSDDRGNRMKPFESYLIGDWIGWNIAPEGADEQVLQVDPAD